jgi:hypothetical protein
MALMSRPPRLQQSAAATSKPTARVWAGDFKGAVLLGGPSVWRHAKNKNGHDNPLGRASRACFLREVSVSLILSAFPRPAPLVPAAKGAAPLSLTHV